MEWGSVGATARTLQTDDRTIIGDDPGRQGEISRAFPYQLPSLGTPAGLRIASNPVISEYCHGS
jgi:hypothetical protein